MPSRLLFCLGLTSLLVNNAWAENASSVEETVLFRAGEEGYPAYRIPSLLTTKRGVVLAFCEARQGGDHGHNDLALKRSTDGARTWSPLRVIVRHPQDAFNNPTSICLRESGRVLLFYEHYPDGTGEQKVVPGYDGNVVSTYVISSDDDGVTWSQPRNISRQVKQETCQASLIRYSDPIDGEPSRLLFSNPAHQTKRVRMTVRLSRDEGKSWPAALLLHKGPSAYSCLTRLPNGDVGILFEAGETGPYETIRLARFPIAWLEAAVPSTTASGQPQPNPSIQGPDNKDRLTNSAMHTLSLEAVVADHKTGRDGNYIPTRVTSTVSPVVVRQNDPNGPKYQEGIGYSFLLNSPKYPGLCKMDDGTLVLTLTASLSGETVSRNGVTFVDENTRTDVMLFSRDNGMSWSQPQRIPGYRTTPMNLGGKRLMLRGWNSKIDVPESYRFWFSEDGGETWSDEEPVAALPDERGVKLTHIDSVVHH